MIKEIDSFRRVFISASLVFGASFLALPGFAAEGSKGDKKEEAELPILPQLGIYTGLNEEIKINLRVVDNKLRLYFLDLEDHVLPLEYPAARVRYENVIKKQRKGRTMQMAPGSDEFGAFLAGTYPFLPPHFFEIYLTLLDPGDPSRDRSFGRQVLNQLGE